MPRIRRLCVTPVYPRDKDDAASVGVGERDPSVRVPLGMLVGFGTHAAGEQLLRRVVDCVLIGQVEDDLVERVDHRPGRLRANDLEVRLRTGQAEDRPVLPVAPTKLVDDAKADEIPLPVHVLGEELPEPTRAPKVGEHTDEILADVLGYDATRIAALRESGGLG